MKKKILITLSIILILCVGGFGFYVNDYYHAQGDALEILKKKKNLRILKLKNLDERGAKYDIKYLEGKVLVQELNTKMIDEMKVVTNAQPTKEQLTDMEFGMKVVKYVKSNAICIVTVSYTHLRAHET